MIGEKWDETRKEENTYNGTGYVTLSITSEWDAGSSMWVITSRREHIYDPITGFLLSNIYFHWNYVHNMLVGYSRTDYEHDTHGNNLSYTYFIWDLILSAWAESIRNVYTYDYNFSGYDILAPWYMWQMITSYITYGYQAGTLKSTADWVETDAFTYHYTDLEVGVSTADISRGDLSIYPNPATEYIQVEGDELASGARIVMYNVSGRMVMNQVLHRGGRIPVSHLSEGIYVIRLVQGSKVKTGKVMIE